MITNKIEINAERVTRGELAGSWRVTAWRGLQYLGAETYLYHTKAQAIADARDTVKQEGGLGIFRNSLA